MINESNIDTVMITYSPSLPNDNSVKNTSSQFITLSLKIRVEDFRNCFISKAGFHSSTAKTDDVLL
jgi:hypothetical protein